MNDADWLVEYADDIRNNLSEIIEVLQEKEDLKEHVQELEERTKRYRKIFEQLYDFDGDVQEHSALADMLCGEALKGESECGEIRRNRPSQ